jgi:hypothetical protein
MLVMCGLMLARCPLTVLVKLAFVDAEREYDARHSDIRKRRSATEQAGAST